MTEAGRTRLFSRCGQLLAFVLAGAMLMQGAGLQASLQAFLESEPIPCACEERGFCPRNPDGPCQCEGPHHSSTKKASAASEDVRGGAGKTESSSRSHGAQPILKNCEGTQPGLFVSAPFYKSIVPDSPEMDSPSFSNHLYKRSLLKLVSQQVGDEIFRPPGLGRVGVPCMLPSTLCPRETPLL